jgi:hypothetical protein
MPVDDPRGSLATQRLDFETNNTTAPEANGRVTAATVLENQRTVARPTLHVLGSSTLS